MSATAVQTVRLGEVLAQSDRAVASSELPEVNLAGVYSFARGLFKRGPMRPAETSYKTYNRLVRDDFVISQPKAWEGALARVTDDFEGWFLSPVFPTFTANPRRLLPAYLEWFCKRKSVWLDLQILSKGMGARRETVSPEQFLSLEIPLPPLDEQHRIVARIEELAAKLEEARGLRKAARVEVSVLQSNSAANAFPAAKETRVCDYIRFQTGYAFKSDWFVPTGIRVARNANVAHGTLDWSDTQYVPSNLRKEFSRFDLKQGDLLVSLDRPLISTGVKVARVREQDLPCLLLQRVARAIFVSDEVVPDYLFAWLHSPAFTTAIDPGRSNGVPHISHKDIEAIPFAVPNREEQLRIVAKLDALQAKVDAVKALQAETAAELDAMLPAILDKAFKGEL